MAASKYERMDPQRLLKRQCSYVTGEDVLEAAICLREMLHRQYLPDIITRILAYADYQPHQKVHVHGHSAVTGSFTYLASDPITSTVEPEHPIDRVKVKTTSRNASPYDMGTSPFNVGSTTVSYTWWSLRKCQPGQEVIVGRRLFASHECPRLWSHKVNNSTFETHEADIYSDDETPLGWLVSGIGSDECLTLVAQGYPEFANCIEEATLHVFMPLGFDLQTESRLWNA